MSLLTIAIIDQELSINVYGIDPLSESVMMNDLHVLMELLIIIVIK